MGIKKLLLQIGIGISVCLYGSVCCAVTSSNNYYNVLLDDVSADKYRYGVDKATDSYKYFKANELLNTVYTYPDFRGFSNLIVPDTTKEHLNYQINMLSKIMTLHRNVKAVNTLESLEYLANECKKGQKVFYPIYSDEEIAKTPSLKDTGLFFLRGNKDAPVAIVVPGGYKYRTILHEGFPIALPIVKRGYNVFVLAYRIGEVNNGAEDLARAINFIAKNRETLKVNFDNYSLWGASVGAQVIINVSHKAITDDNYLAGKPASNVLTYPLSFFAHKKEIPTFIVVGAQDQIVNSTILKSSVANMRKNQIASEYLEMPRLGHGFGLGIDRDSSVGVNWISRAVSFWTSVSDLNEGNY